MTLHAHLEQAEPFSHASRSLDRGVLIGYPFVQADASVQADTSVQASLASYTASSPRSVCIRGRVVLPSIVQGL
jgi:hypothetical protein